MKNNEINLVGDSIGYLVNIFINNINSIFFNIPETEITFLKADDISYKLISNEFENNTLKPINACKMIKIEIGIFSSEEQAICVAENFILNFRAYLSKKSFKYEKITYIISDLSKIEFRTGFGANISLGKLTRFDFDKIFNVLDDNKITTSIKLIEMANNVNETILAFMLYVVTLESLIDDIDTKKAKEIETIDFIDNVINHVENICIDVDKKFICDKLTELKTIGSRKAVVALIEKACPNKVIFLDGKNVAYKKIYHLCYDIRNKFVHNGITKQEADKYLSAIKTVSYDVLYWYMEQNKLNKNN